LQDSASAKRKKTVSLRFVLQNYRFEVRLWGVRAKLS
jgi:hypothetical protein